MKKMFVALMLFGLVCGAALLVLWAAVGLPTDGVHVIVNDHELNVAELSAWNALLAGSGLMLALGVVALVLPLALLLGLLLPLLLVLGAALLVLAVVLGAGAVALAPLLLPVVLIWWLWRRSQRRAQEARPPAGPTPPPAPPSPAAPPSAWARPSSTIDA